MLEEAVLFEIEVYIVFRIGIFTRNVWSLRQMLTARGKDYGTGGSNFLLLLVHQ